MKKTITLILAIGLMIFFIASYNYKLSYKEGELYSGKNIFDLNKNDYNNANSSLLTRSQALYMAMDVFKKGFGIDISKENVSEFVGLSKENDAYMWNIIWRVKNTEKAYICYINSKTKEINEVSISNRIEKENNKYAIGSDIDSEVDNIIGPLMNYLKIELSKYKKYNQDLLYGKTTISRFHTYTFVDKTKAVFNVRIDMKDKKVVSYYKTNG